MTYDFSDLGGVRVEPKTKDKSNGYDFSDLGGVRIESEPEESYGRMAAQAPRNFAAGLGDVIDLPIMGANYLLGKAHAKSPAGTKKIQIPYPGNKIAEGIDTLTGGYTAPQTKRERVVEAGTRAVGSLASGFGGGMKLAQIGGKAISKLGRGLAKINPLNPTSAAATAAGASAGQSYRESRPDDLLGSLGTGLAADMAVRSGLGIFNKRNWGNALKINPKHMESFREAGISPTLGQVSDFPLVKVGENIIKETSPFNKLRNANDAQYKHIEETLGPGATNLAQTELQIGKSLKKSMAKYGHKVSETTEKLKQDYLDKVAKSPVGDLVDVTDSLNFFEKIKKDVAKTVRSEKILAESPLGKKYDDLKSIASENKGTVHLSEAQEFRRTLQDAIDKGELGSVSKGRLTRFRKLVNDDIKDHMEGIGALKEWNKYNNYYKKYAETKKIHLAEAQEIPKHKANEIFDNIGHSGKLDRNLLDTAYASQNKTAKKQTMDALIQKIGKQGDEFSPHLFAKRFINQPKETQNTFLLPLSEPMRKKFKGVMGSISAMKELNKFGNPSRTAYTSAVMHGAKVAPLMALNYYRGNDQTDTIWQAGFLMVLSYAASNKIMANPKFINWAYKGTQLKTPKSKIHHLEGLKGIIGRPAYQEIKNVLGEKKPD